MAGKAAGGLVPAGFVAHLPQPDLTKETFCEWNCDLYSYDPASESPPRPPGALSVPQCPPIVIPPVRPYDGQQAILVAARDKTPGLSDILLTAYQRGIRHAVRQLYLSRAHAQNERGRDRDNRPDGADEGETLPAQKSSEKGFASSAFSAAVEFLDVVGSILPWLKSTPITSVALFSVAPSWSISPVRACGWHRHLPRLAVAMPDNSIRLYDFTVHRFVHSPLRHASQRDVTCIEWRPLAGATFAAGGAEGIVLWKVSGWTSSRLTANGSAVGAVTSSTLTLRGHAPVVAMAWSPDGRYLASGSPNDSRVVIWDVTTQQRTVLRRGGDGGITCLAWSPCGTRVFAASDSGAFRVWETQNWTCDRWAPTPGAGRCKTAAWSPNGRVILFAFERSPRVYALTFDLPAPATDGRTVIAIDCAPTHVTATVNTNRHASPEPGDDAGSASSGPSADVTSGAALPKSPRSPGRPSRATEGFTPSVRAASEGDRRRKYREELNAYMRARGGLPVPESRVDAYRQVYDPLFYLYLKAYGIEDLMERREREMYPFLDDPLTNATALTADQRRQLERILDNAVVVKGRRAPNPLTSDIISAGGNDDDNDADGSIRGVSPVGSNSASRLTSARGSVAPVTSPQQPPRTSPQHPPWMSPPQVGGGGGGLVTSTPITGARMGGDSVAMGTPFAAESHRPIVRGVEEITLGGNVRSIAWDASGERLVVLCGDAEEGSVAGDVALLFRTGTQPYLEIVPSGVIRGPCDAGAPQFALFVPGSLQGALLSMFHLGGRVSFVPMVFVPTAGVLSGQLNAAVRGTW